MSKNASFEPRAAFRPILLLLRICVAVQCLGNWRWMTQLEETPLLHWMLDPADIGGLGWTEPTALAIQQSLGWLVLLAAFVVCWRPSAVVLIPLTLFQLLITVAMWRVADGYALQASWLPPQLLVLFPFATQFLRVVTPLGLLILERAAASSPPEAKLFQRTIVLLRWAIAIVFLAHGLEALQANPKFVDLILLSVQRVLGVSLAESTAVHCLTAIGVVDVILAAACVSVRLLPMMWWLAFWGGLTAVSRILSQGWDVAWHETFTRISHFGVPLAVALWWHLLKSNPSTASAIKQTQNNSARNQASATAKA